MVGIAKLIAWADSNAEGRLFLFDDVVPRGRMAHRRTVLFQWHVDHAARTVPFGGWEMPVQYASVIEEHKTVRSAVGFFDVSHMARLTFVGADAEALLEKVFTNSVATMKPGQVRYGLICNQDGGILDDVLVTRFDNEFAMCVNAGNRQTILGWLHTFAVGMEVTIQEQTFTTAMIAVQGPKAVETVKGLLGDDVSALKYYTAMRTTYAGQPCIASRTGYTGEDGFELIVPGSQAVAFVNELVSRGAKPCGLGARDTLRLEAAMPLYGHELNDTIDPIQAGLAWAVKLEKGEFLGRDAIRLASEASDGFRSTRIGLQLEGNRAAREGSGIQNAAGEPLGKVTSGSYVPWLDRSIAMGYVPAEHAAIGNTLNIDIRGSIVPAVVVALPFYKRSA